MESGFRQHCLAGQKRQAERRSKISCPQVMPVLFPQQGDKITGIYDGIHYSRENPLRDETSRGPPLITPANSSNGFFSSREREFSTAWRTTRPTGSPVRRDFWRSRSISSCGRRTVIVLLI